MTSLFLPFLRELLLVEGALCAPCLVTAAGGAAIGTGAVATGRGAETDEGTGAGAGRVAAWVSAPELTGVADNGTEIVVGTEAVPAIVATGAGATPATAASLISK